MTTTLTHEDWAYAEARPGWGHYIDWEPDYAGGGVATTVFVSQYNEVLEHPTGGWLPCRDGLPLVDGIVFETPGEAMAYADWQPGGRNPAHRNCTWCRGYCDPDTCASCDDDCY